METETISFETTVELNSKDRLKATLYNVFFRRKWVTCYVGIFIIGSIFLVGAWLFKIYNIPSVLALVAGGFLFLLVSLVTSLVMTSQGATTTRWLKFDASGLTTNAGRDNKTLFFKWGDMYYVGKSKNYFYFYLDASQFIIVPQRHLATAEITMLKKYV